MDFNSFKEEMNKNLNSLKIILNDEQMKIFYNFMNLLIKKNKVVNLTAITEPKEIIIKHFVDSLTIAQYLEDNQRLIDIGTGAGFPGIPLKINNSSLDICLLDSLNKRVNFLNEVIEENKLTKIQASHGRAEDFGQNQEYREKFDVAVSRAVAPFNILLEYMLPFVKVGGMCICMKGNMLDKELEDANRALNVLGGSIEKIQKFLLADTDNNRTIILVKKTNETPKTYPRKPGTPSKQPL